jgi:hypothetical protein
MKKYLIILLLTAGASQLKAQQLTLKPSSLAFNKAPADLSLLQFKLSDSTLFKALPAFPKSAQLAALTSFNSNNKNAEVFIAGCQWPGYIVMIKCQ